MPERWVVNASPIILLSKIEYHHLLIRLSDQIVVPEAVAEEIRNGSAGDPARRFLDSRGFHVVAEPPEPDILAWDLGAGETAVLSYARTNPGWRVVIDDGMARRCARSFSIPVIGACLLMRSIGSSVWRSKSPQIPRSTLSGSINRMLLREARPVV